MEHYKDTWDQTLTPEKKLNVIIVGAGIGGLTTGIALKQSGHEVTILEQVRAIAEVGAGIQMAPNNMRILGRLGVLPEILEQVNHLTKISLRRWQNNEELGKAPLMPKVAEVHGAPMGVIHRADLQRILMEAAVRAKCDIRVNSKVARVDENFEARLQLTSGEWIEGDLIVAADGIKSTIRKQIAEKHNHKDKVVSTGDSAYRVLIPKEKMQDETSLGLLAQNVGMRWMGPQGHVMGYPLRGNTVYNMVLIHPETRSSGSTNTEDLESWLRKGDKSQMLEFYKDWCPELRQLLSYVPEGELMEWTLNSHTPLPSWYENKVVLIGDACHPMLPYVAQGAAQAMEDAAVLQCVLAGVPNDIRLALEVYEEVRKGRGEKVQSSAAVTRKVLHYVDGPEQQDRDLKIKLAAVGKARNPDLWADKEFQRYLWSTDIMQETLDRLADVAELEAGV